MIDDSATCRLSSLLVEFIAITTQHDTNAPPQGGLEAPLAAYLAITDPDALAVSFAGYVGSSKLSASGIDGGVEWNVGTDRVEQLVAGF